MGFLPLFGFAIHGEAANLSLSCSLPLEVIHSLGCFAILWTARTLHAIRRGRAEPHKALFFGLFSESLSGKKDKSTLIGSQQHPPLSDPLDNRCWVKPKLPCYIPQ